HDEGGDRRGERDPRCGPGAEIPPAQHEAPQHHEQPDHHQRAAELNDDAEEGEDGESLFGCVHRRQRGRWEGVTSCECGGPSAGTVARLGTAGWSTAETPSVRTCYPERRSIAGLVTAGLAGQRNNGLKPKLQTVALRRGGEVVPTRTPRSLTRRPRRTSRGCCQTWASASQHAHPCSTHEPRVSLRVIQIS